MKEAAIVARMRKRPSSSSVSAREAGAGVGGGGFGQFPGDDGQQGVKTGMGRDETGEAGKQGLAVLELLSTSDRGWPYRRRKRRFRWRAVPSRQDSNSSGRR